MPATRREFLAASAAVAAATWTGAGHAAPARAKRPLRILILGGTGFLGPACAPSELGSKPQIMQSRYLISKLAQEGLDWLLYTCTVMV